MKNNSFASYRPSSVFAYFPFYSKGIYLWQVKSLIQFILILLVSKAFFFGALFLIPITNAADSPALDARGLIHLTNSERTINGLPRFFVNEKLTQAAEKKADDIIAHGYFAHTTPDGKPFYQWVREENYSYKSAGENLAISFISNQDTMRAWMNSKTHRENILDPNFTEIGIAVSVGNFNEKTTAVAVQMFGEPSQTQAILTGATLGVATQYSNKPNVGASEMIDVFNFLNNSVNAALIILFALFIVLTLKNFAIYRRLIFKSTNARSFPAESAIPQ